MTRSTGNGVLLVLLTSIFAFCITYVLLADEDKPPGDQTAELTYHDGLQDGHARMTMVAVNQLMRSHTDSMKWDREQLRGAVVRAYLRARDRFPSPSTRYEQGWKDGVEKAWKVFSF